MLPSLLINDTDVRFFQTETLGLLPHHAMRLQAAREFQQEVATVVDTERMTYVAGCDRLTVIGVESWEKLGRINGYRISRDGDGTVLHRLGRLEDLKGALVPTFYLSEEHGRLPANDDVLRACEAILQGPPGMWWSAIGSNT